MNEESLNNPVVNPEQPEAAAPVAPAPAVPVEPAAPVDATVPEAVPAEPAAPVDNATGSTPVEEPQIIVQKERGFAHYVGFALLCVLCVFFFFLPGIALTFGVSRLVDLNGAAAWIFSAIFSFVAWLIFKLKIKGFKKSFFWYLGLCALVLAILVTIEVLAENINVFSGIFALLTGAAG